MDNLDDTQASAVCCALLGKIGLIHLWRGGQLLDEAIELLQVPGNRISKEDQAVLLLVWRLSNGRSRILPETDLTPFGCQYRSSVETLLHALESGHDAVTRWLGEQTSSLQVTAP